MKFSTEKKRGIKHFCDNQIINSDDKTLIFFSFTYFIKIVMKLNVVADNKTKATINN